MLKVTDRLRIAMHKSVGNKSKTYAHAKLYVAILTTNKHPR